MTAKRLRGDLGHVTDVGLGLILEIAMFILVLLIFLKVFEVIN